MMYTKKKGVTLIELIITIAILSIVLSVIGSFFFTNYKALNSVNKDLELQSKGEKAINCMMDSIIDGYGVVEVKAIEGSPETEISKLAVTKELYTSVFELRNGILYYGKGTLTDINGKANEKVCNSIKSIMITTLPIGESFSNCTGLKIKITMASDKTGKLEKVFGNEVYFRNKEVKIKVL
ncbi:type II secretion system protein [Clostridium tagluense]|uniref:Prepilin-type N-terminal cleavage/methylation domain-containing protein n=1 Tax=Clostridium tagluense TaxID=360422 RepID=A0A401UUR2_9CLOT|nr:prepilin-type N-terminal cleavage/methylation domain-containing protein [Clostridium tagluense]GCD13234.1 hypothetical protein Ctaglu_48570 [Clostridium tagluense]